MESAAVFRGNLDPINFWIVLFTISEKTGGDKRIPNDRINSSYIFPLKMTVESKNGRIKKKAFVAPFVNNINIRIVRPSRADEISFGKTKIGRRYCLRSSKKDHRRQQERC